MCVYVSVCVCFNLSVFLSLSILSLTLTHIHICSHMCRVTGWPQKCSADTIYLGLQDQKSKMASKLVTQMYIGPSPRYRGYKVILLCSAVLTSFIGINLRTMCSLIKYSADCFVSPCSIKPDILIFYSMFLFFMQ